jgi:hypothetical protein
MRITKSMRCILSLIKERGTMISDELTVSGYARRTCRLAVRNLITLGLVKTRPYIEVDMRKLVVIPI